MIGYIKTPPDSGGIGDDKHLYQITYNGIETGNNALYGTFSNYYSLYNNSKLDIAGMSSYFDEKEMMKSRSEYATLLKDSFPQKPFHFDEGNSPGFILNDTKTTSTHYNNYDVTFHNELWASAFMGGFTTLGPWEGEVVHRWKHATPEELGDSIPMTVHDSGPPFTPISVQEIIKNFYHNFRPLSDFVALMDFNQNYMPTSYYGGTSDFIESYYLKTIDSLNAYGWVHNINKYWMNNFYWENNLHTQIVENFYGCDTFPIPDTIFTISGFKQNSTYYVYFFKTRIGNQILPITDTLVSDTGGNLTLKLSSAPLGCDSLNADYAYFISDEPHTWNDTRIAKPHSYTQTQGKIEVSIVPNPSRGIFTLMVTGVEEGDRSRVEITDFTGKVILKNNLPKVNQLILNLSNQSKGIYLLKITSGFHYYFKRITIL